MSQAHIGVADLLAAPRKLWTHDAYTCSLAEADRSFEAELTFVADRAGPLSGLATWFLADLAEGSTLTNAPGAPDTHWGRFVFPLHRTVEVPRGASIRVAFRCDPASPGSCEFVWSVQIGGGPIERHDSRKSRA